MKNKLTLSLLILAAVSINLHAASSTLPAPLPGLMDQQQLAQWNANQQALGKTVSDTEEVANQFYTGKPYLAEVGGYIYKYRTYNPEMTRWTTSDISGYPDGANNNIYTSHPLSDCDPDGLKLVQGTVSPNAGLTANAFVTASLAAVTSASYANTSLTGSVVSSITSYLTSFVNNNVPNISVSGITAQVTGTADFDTNTSSWSNPGLVPNSGANGSGGTTYNINATVAGVGVTGTLGFLVTYTLSGSAVLQNQTSTSAIDHGNFVPTITATLSLNLNPGAGVTSSGSSNSTAFTADVTLNE